VRGKRKVTEFLCPNNRLIVLHREPARYTNAAREARAQGEIILSIEFRADGTIKVLNIVRGLGFGLDEKAVAAAQKIIFLPVINDETFVNMSSRLEFTFDLY
jgi:periplasmic protein TonB